MNVHSVAEFGRIRAAITEEQRKGEILVGWVQAVVVVIWAVLYAISRKTFPSDAAFEPVPWTLAFYGVFLASRLALIYFGRVNDWFVATSIIVDMAVLMVLIWSFHIQYRQPPAFYLKAPTLLYVFIFIALRALRFEARWVLLAGASAAVGWIMLIAYAVWFQWDANPITHNYVQYMTSSSILVGAEIDKIISILIVSVILAVVLNRAQGLMHRAAVDHATALDLARFVSNDVADAISGSETSLEPGQGEIRPAAALFVDLRGFTTMAQKLAPVELMRLLGEYQGRVVPLIQKHGGSIDKFMGDGILASFGAVHRSQTYAADAISAIVAIVHALEDWRQQRRADNLPAPDFSIGVASGEVLFGIVGDKTRLEYTVIGSAVNIAAKLEKHTRVERVTALADAETLSRAKDQGFDDKISELRKSRVVIGLDAPTDVVVLAK
jgi:adenylate cyclase